MHHKPQQEKLRGEQRGSQQNDPGRARGGSGGSSQLWDRRVLLLSAVLDGGNQQICFKPRDTHSFGFADEPQAVGIAQDIPVERFANLAQKWPGVHAVRDVIDRKAGRLRRQARRFECRLTRADRRFVWFGKSPGSHTGRHAPSLPHARSFAGENRSPAPGRRSRRGLVVAIVPVVPSRCAAERVQAARRQVARLCAGATNQAPLQRTSASRGACIVAPAQSRATCRRSCQTRFVAGRG
jgi:hypothetical protein